MNIQTLNILREILKQQLQKLTRQQIFHHLEAKLCVQFKFEKNYNVTTSDGIYPEK